MLINRVSFYDGIIFYYIWIKNSPNLFIHLWPIWLIPLIIVSVVNHVTMNTRVQIISSNYYSPPIWTVVRLKLYLFRILFTIFLLLGFGLPDHFFWLSEKTLWCQLPITEKNYGLLLGQLKVLFSIAPSPSPLSLPKEVLNCYYKWIFYFSLLSWDFCFVYSCCYYCLLFWFITPFSFRMIPLVPSCQWIHEACLLSWHVVHV